MQMMKNMKIKILITLVALVSCILGFNAAAMDSIKHKDVIELVELDKQVFDYAAEGIALAYKSGVASCDGDISTLINTTDRAEELNKKIDQIKASRNAVIGEIGL